MINSFDINAILNSKIEELKNAEPTAKKVNALFKSLTDSIESIFETMYNSYIDTDTVKRYVSNVNYMVGSSGIGKIASSFAELGTSLSDKNLRNGVQNFHKVKDTIMMIIQDFASINGEIKKYLIQEKTEAIETADKIGTEVQNPTNIISVLFKNISNIVKTIASTGTTLITLPIKAKIFKHAIGSLKGIVLSISKIVDDNKKDDLSEKIAILTNAVNIIGNIGKNVLVMAISLTLAVPVLLTALPAIVLLKGVMSGLKWLSKSFDDKAVKNITSFTSAMKNIAISLVAVALAFAALTLIVSDGSILAGAAKFIISIALLCTSIALIVKTGINKDVKSFSISMLALSGALLTTVASLILLSYMEKEIEWSALIQLSVVLFGLVGLTILVNKVSKNALKGVLALVAMVGAMTLLAVSLLFISFLLDDIDIVPLLIIFGALAILSVTLILISKFSSNILKGVLALILITASLYIVALTINKMMDVAEGITLENTLSFFGVLTAMVGSVIALGALISMPPVLLFAAVGSVTLLALVGVFIAVAHSIKKMNEIIEDVNTDTISIMSDAIKSMISAISGISLKDLAKAGIAGAALTPFLLMIGLLGFTMASIAKLTMPIEFDENGKPIGFKQMGSDDFAMVSTNVEYMINTLTGAINKISQIGNMQMLKATAMSAMMTIILLPISAMVSVISSMANLKFATKWDKDGNPIEYEELTPDKLSQVKDNVALIVDTMVNAIAGLSDKISKGEAFKNSIIMTLMGTCVEPVAGMVKTISDVAQGRIATEWDKDGNPTNWVSFSDIDFNKVSANIQSCLTSYVNALKNSGLEDDSSFFGEDGPLAKAKKGIALIAEVTEPVSLMVDAVLKTQESASKYDLTKLAFKDVLAQYKEGMKVFEDVDADSIKNNIQAYSSFNTTLDKILKIDEKAVKNNKEFVDNNIKLLDKINTLKVDNIKGVTDMFAKMADFSKTINGNFTKLAEAFSEELIKALDKLSDAIQGGFDTKVSVSAPAISSSTSGQNIKSAIKPEDINNIIKSINDLKDVLQKPIQVTNNPTKPLIVANRNI